MKPVIIFGTQTIAKTALHILKSNQWLVYGFIPHNQTSHPTTICEVPILHKPAVKQLIKQLGKKCVAFVAIENKQQRKKIIQELMSQNSEQLISAIHPQANLPRDINLGTNNLIDISTSLAPSTNIGSGCIIGGHTLIAPDVTIHDFVHIGPGSIIQQGVTIDKEAYIGPGSIILPNINISQGAYIKPGSIITDNT